MPKCCYNTLMIDMPVFQVSECIEALNHHLSLLGEFVVEGEISRIDIKNHNLLFLTIKDKSSAIDIFSMAHIIKNYRQFEPGMLVHIYGTAGLYKGSGKFRLFANQIVPHGEGALQIAFDKLKAQLEAEGVFDPSHKRPLPLWPHSIGLITATNSSAYHDQVKIISSRMGGLTLKHLPVSVQGREAVGTILTALAYVNAHPQDFDVIILARGGGSLEDLAAFNSEAVCRAVFACKVPIISAVGHEDDWSLTDFVADVRASTPSNAAEMVVKDKREVEAELTYVWQHLKQSLNNQLTLRHHKVSQEYQLIRRSIEAFTTRITRTFDDVSKIKHRLLSQITLSANNIHHLERLLISLDHHAVLARGYSITKNESGQILKTAHMAKSGDRLTTQLHQGEIKSIIM
jgi:exodeoxyribonuclease VII large subunit